MASCRAVTAEELEEHFDRNMFRMLEYFHVAGATVSMVSYKEPRPTPPESAVNAYYADELEKVERVINLWCECGKPFAPPALGTYYASGTWNMPRLYNDIDALQKIKTPNSTPGKC